MSTFVAVVKDDDDMVYCVYGPFANEDEILEWAEEQSQELDRVDAFLLTSPNP